MSPRTPRLVVDAATSRRLARVRQRGTAAELRVRDLLRALGVRAGRSQRRLPGSPDVANIARRWCIFVHGCFWHSHLGCAKATVPKRNREFWTAKFDANEARDQRVAAELRALGFRVVVIWECELERSPAKVTRRLSALRTYAAKPTRSP